MFGAVIFMTACSGTSVQSATPGSEVTEGGGSAMCGTRSDGIRSVGGGAELSPAIVSHADAGDDESRCATFVPTHMYYR